MKTLVATPDPVCPWQRYVPVWVMLLLIERYGRVRIESFETRSEDCIQISHRRPNGELQWNRFRISTKSWYYETDCEEMERRMHIRAAMQIARDGYRRRAEQAAWNLTRMG